MTFLLPIGLLLVLLLVVVISATNAQRDRGRLAEAAKIRADMRSNSKDVWESNVPAKAVIHDDKPIEYDASIHIADDVSDSEYQVLKAIFAETHPAFRSNTEQAKLEANYWADTDHLGISHE